MVITNDVLVNFYTRVMRRVLRKFRKWNCVDPFRGVSVRKKLFRSTDMKVWVICSSVGISCAAILHTDSDRTG